MITLEEILKAMEKMWEPKEEEFRMAELLLNLPVACPDPNHIASERDFDLMRWKCCTCEKVLEPTSVSS